MHSKSKQSVRQILILKQKYHSQGVIDKHLRRSLLDNYHSQALGDITLKICSKDCFSAQLLSFCTVGIRKLQL